MSEAYSSTNGTSIWRPLERGWTKRKLIRELAQMEKPQTQLADEYGVSQPAISGFLKRYRAEVEAVKADIENEFAGLWIANKFNRLAEYQEDAERITGNEDPEMMRIKHNILKAVAEELGQLPSKMNISVGNKQINYVIEGVDMDALKDALG